MNTCAVIRPLLPLSEGGEVTPEQSRLIEEHLSHCSSCQSEHDQFLGLISCVRGIRQGEYRLADSVRRRIALEAAERAARGPWGFPIFTFPYRTAWMASAAALVVLAALTAGFWMKSRATPARQDEISKLEVVAERGVVRLAWSDGMKASYTVYKTVDPRLAGRGEVHVVKGNVWVDAHPESSPVVFYRIE